MRKKLYTREEFEQFRKHSALEMAKDHKLQEDALGVLVNADKYNWIHQTNWLGEPLLNLPQDMFAIQDIIFRTQPEYIIEMGVAWGGSILFYATLQQILGGKKVIGVDIYIPDDLRQRLNASKVSQNIELINASSVDESTAEKIKAIVGTSKNNLIILDSFHTHEHVLRELNLYSPIVGKGSYIICCDTVVDLIPEQVHRERPWGRGNNPKTALVDFLRQNPRFEVDHDFDKLLLSCNISGYIKANQD